MVVKPDTDLEDPRPVIVLDIDGVCCDQVTAFNQWAAKLAGVAPIPFEETEYLWFKRYPNGDELWKQFLGPQNAHRWLRAKPITGAKFGVRTLARQYDIVFATYRPQHAEKVTKDWLQVRLGVEDPKVIFTKDKSSVPGVAYLDDHGETVMSLLAHGLNAFVFDAPWNRECDGTLRRKAAEKAAFAKLPRLTGWVEVVQTLHLPGVKRKP